MDVAEAVHLVGVERGERAVDLVDGDAEDEDEHEDVEQNPQFDDESVFEQDARAEDADAILEDEESEHLRDGLPPRADQEQPRAHCREGDGNGQFARNRLVDVQELADGEAGRDDQEDEQLRDAERDKRLHLALGMDFPHGVEQKRRKCQPFDERVDDRNCPDAQTRCARARPVPKQERQKSDEPALCGDEADGGREASRSGEQEVRQQEQGQQDFGCADHGKEFSVQKRTKSNAPSVVRRSVASRTCGVLRKRIRAIVDSMMPTATAVTPTPPMRSAKRRAGAHGSVGRSIATRKAASSSNLSAAP